MALKLLLQHGLHQVDGQLGDGPPVAQEGLVYDLWYRWAGSTRGGGSLRSEQGLVGGGQREPIEGPPEVQAEALGLSGAG